MKATVGDYLLERLRDWGVEHVFAYAGDGINGILAAWGRAENRPQFIQARHEEWPPPRPPGHLGDAGDGGRTDVHAVAAAA